MRQIGQVPRLRTAPIQRRDGTAGRRGTPTGSTGSTTRSHIVAPSLHSIESSLGALWVVREPAPAPKTRDHIVKASRPIVPIVRFGYSAAHKRRHPEGIATSQRRANRRWPGPSMRSVTAEREKTKDPKR